MKTIQVLFHEEAVVLTQHFMYRIEKRGISLSEVNSSIHPDPMKWENECKTRKVVY